MNRSATRYHHEMSHQREDTEVDWKPRLSLSTSRIFGRAKYRYLVFTIVFVATAALIPHLVDGHVFFLPRAYAESIGIILNMGVALVFYALYRRDVRSALLERDRSEDKLLSSYKYIGKANRSIQMLQKYSGLPAGKLDEKDMKGEIRSMVEELAAEVFAADSALFRFINSNNGRTLAEFGFLKNEMSRQIKFSNRLLLRKHTGMIKNAKALIFISKEYAGFDIVCAAGFDQVQSVVDKETLTALVNQIFLLFVFAKSVGLSGSLLERLKSER